MNIKNVYIFLFDGFSDWEISYLAPELVKSENVNLKYFSIDGLEITSMGGLKIIPDLSIQELEIDTVSALILPGGSAWEKKSIRGIDNLVEKLYIQNKTIASICSATTFLGQKGYLDTINHTSNALDYMKYISPEYKGENYYQSDLAVSHKNIITANGFSPIEFAREIFIALELKSNEEIEKWFQLFKHGVWVD